MKIRCLIVFILTCLSVPADDAFKQGIDAYHDSEYASATSAFKTAVVTSETAAAHHNLALALYQQGKVSESAWHLERAILLEPKNKPYHFKLIAIRQELSLPNSRPKWHELASRLLSQQSWVLILSIACWITVAAIWLPKAGKCRTSLIIKAGRNIGLIVLIVAATALYQNRNLASSGVVLGDSRITLHAAPAGAAPQIGLARPGERGQQVDQHGDYIEIKTEGGARGWIHKKHYRLIQR